MTGADVNCIAVDSIAHFKVGAPLDSIAGPLPQVPLTWGEGLLSGGTLELPWQGGVASAGTDVCDASPGYSPRHRAPHWAWIAITAMSIEHKLFINGYRNRRVSQEAKDERLLTESSDNLQMRSWSDCLSDANASQRGPLNSLANVPADPSS